MANLRNVDSAMLPSGNIDFIESNPAIGAYREGVRFDQETTNRDLANENTIVNNQLNRASAPSRLRTINAGATDAETNASVNQQTAPYRVRSSAAGARNAEAGATTAEVGAKYAEPNAAAGLRTHNANATTAEVGAKYAEPNAAANLRQHSATALNTEMQGFYKALELLNAGDIEGAQAVAKATGQQIPQVVIENADVRAAVTQFAKQAQAAYPNRPADQQTYIKSGLEEMAKRKQAGGQASSPTAPYEVPNAPAPPTEANPSAHNFQVFNQVENDANGKPITKPYSFDTRTAATAPITGAGEGGGLQRPGSGGDGAGGGKTSVFQQKQAAWLATHPGDAQGALDYASGRRQMSEPEIAKAAISMARAEANGQLSLKFNQAKAQAFIQQRAGEIAQQLRTGLAPPAPAAGAPAPTAPPASTAPAVAPPAPSPQAAIPQRPDNVPPGSAYSPSRQMWKSPDGQLFDENGQPVAQ